MGKVEKLVVLSVLFLVALILVVSFTMDDPAVVDAGSNPQPAVAEMPADPQTPVAKGDMLPTPPVNAATLSSVVDTSAKVAAAPQETMPAGSILKTMDGLEDSVLPNFKLYTWKEGDSYRLVANTYYGDWKLLTLLRDANAGREDLQPGDRIMVPVYADASIPPAEGSGTVAQVDSAPVAAPVAAKEPAKKEAAAKKETAKKDQAKTAAKKSTGGKEYVVKKGDTLGKIAKKELGDTGRWKEIQTLNNIAKPEAIKVGMKLKLP